MIDKTVGLNTLKISHSKQLFSASEQLEANSRSDFKEVLGKMLADGTKKMIELPRSGIYISPDKLGSLI